MKSSPPVSPFIYFCVFLFGLSTWITINGIFSQVPIFFNILPEKYEVATLIVFIVQLSNIFPFLYSFISVFIPKRWNYNVETVIIYFILLVGFVSSLLFGFVWDKTVTIAGKEISIALFIVVFLMGSVDCLTSVIYFPFISNYKYHYSSSLSFGASSTGLIVGLIAMIQQPGNTQPNFSVTVFSFFLVIITIVSALGFTILRFSKYGRDELTIQKEDSVEKKEDIEEMDGQIFYQEWTTFDTLRLMLTNLIVSLVENGIFLSLLPYTLNKYKSGNQLNSWTINLSLILKPLFSYMAYITPYYQPIIMNSIWILITIFQVVISLFYPNPPLKSSIQFGILIVLLLTFGAGLMSFCKTKELLIAHEKFEKIDKNTNFTFQMSPFRKAGIGMQLGSLIGSLTVTLFIYFYFPKV